MKAGGTIRKRESIQGLLSSDDFDIDRRVFCNELAFLDIAVGHNYTMPPGRAVQKRMTHRRSKE